MRRRGQLAIAAAAIGWSLAGVLQRGLQVSTATQLAGRAFFAGLTMLVIVALDARRSGVTVWSLTRSIGRVGMVMACVMALASIFFVIALNNATVASVLFIQALAPSFAVVLARVFLGEVASRRTWIATAVAFAGVGIMVGDPGRISALGVFSSLAMTLAFASAIVLARRGKAVSMTPAVLITQVMLLAGGAMFAAPSAITSSDLWRLVLLGVFQMGISQLLFVVGARLIPASETALITLLEVVAGPLWVWMAYRENPGVPTLIGGAIIIAAVVYQTVESVEPVATVPAAPV